MKDFMVPVLEEVVADKKVLQITDCGPQNPSQFFMAHLKLNSLLCSILRLCFCKMEKENNIHSLK